MSRTVNRIVYLAAAAAATLLLVPLLTGCGEETGSAKQDSESWPVTVSGPQLLRQMIARYQQADSYSDDGVLRIQYKQDGKLQSYSEDLRVTFARPNRLRMAAYNVRLSCDGRSLSYRVIDQPSGDMDNQFVQRPAPAKLSLEQLLGRDPILNHFISGGAGLPVALELLSAKRPLEPLFADRVSWQVQPSRLANHACYRVQATTADGDFVMWIDRESYLLHRLEYPAARYLPPLAQLEGVEDLSLVAELRRAKFNAGTAAKFQLARPQNAKLVKYFVTLPPPLPTDLFGRRPNRFRFTDLSGRPVAQRQLDGSVTVLLWFAAHPNGRVCLQQLQAVQQQLPADADVRLLAVCTEPSTSAAHQDIAQLMQSWAITLPTVRDLEPVGQRQFGITALPTIVVLDPAGRVQYFQVLAEPALDQVLPVVLQRLLEGDQLAEEILREHQNELAHYHRALQIAAVDGQLPLTPTVPTAVAAASQPEHLRLTRRWRCEDVKSPGNLLVVADAEREQRILVVDGWQTIVGLDDGGRVQQRRRLQLPDRMGISYVRTGRDAEGHRWFVASEVLGRQLHVFDRQWKYVTSFPHPERPHGGVSDVRIMDPDSDGEPEIYAGFRGELGVQQISLSGKRLGENLTPAEVVSLAPAGGQLLATSGRGQIVRLDRYLSINRTLTVPGHPVRYLYPAHEPRPDAAVACGLYFRDEATLVAVGLSRQMQALWQSELPGGVFERQVQFVASGRLLGGSQIQWVVARPDGSIHVLGDDGSFQDKFHLGHPPTGIAVARIDGRSVLLVSTAEQVIALEVAPSLATARSSSPEVPTSR